MCGAFPSRLSSGEVPGGRRVCGTWFECGSRILDDELGSLSPPPSPHGLSPRPPVGTTCTLPVWGRPDQSWSGWGHPWQVKDGWGVEQSRTQPAEGCMGEVAQARVAPDLPPPLQITRTSS